MYVVLIIILILWVIAAIPLAFIAPNTIPAMLAFAIIFGLEIRMYRRLNATRITLGDTHYQHVSSGGLRRIPYEEIRRIEAKSVRYLGGWLKIIPSEGKLIRIAMNLEDGDDLIRTLKNKMAERGLQDRYDENALFSYFKTSTYGLASWTRMGFGAVFFVLGFILLFFTSTLFALFDVEPRFAWILLLPCTVGIGPYLYLEFGLFLKRIRKQEMRPDWILDPGDPAADRRLVFWATLWFFLVSVASLLLGFVL